jgi:hypothetical protein
MPWVTPPQNGCNYCCAVPFCSGVTHGILQQRRAYDWTHCTIVLLFLKQGVCMCEYASLNRMLIWGTDIEIWIVALLWGLVVSRILTFQRNLLLPVLNLAVIGSRETWQPPMRLYNAVTQNTTQSVKVHSHDNLNPSPCGRGLEYFPRNPRES